MTYRYHAPLDPNCPDVKEFYKMLSDPMTKVMGAPVEDITSFFERKHQGVCQRCLNYGVANIEVTED